MIYYWVLFAIPCAIESAYIWQSTLSFLRCCHSCHWQTSRVLQCVSFSGTSFDVHKLLFSGKIFAVEEFHVHTLGAEGIVSWLLLTVAKASQSTANKLCLISDNSQIFLLMCLFCKSVLPPDIYFDNFYCWYNKVRPAVLQLLQMWNPLILDPDQGCSFWCMSASSPRSVTNWASMWDYNIRNLRSSFHTILECQMSNSKSLNSKFFGLIILPYNFRSHNILTAIKVKILVLMESGHMGPPNILPIWA